MSGFVVRADFGQPASVARDGGLPAAARVGSFYLHCAVSRYCARKRIPGLRAATRIQFANADTQSKALSGSLFESFVTSRASFRAGRSSPTSVSKHDASNNSDVVSNNNREIWHVKVNLDFEVCVSRHF
ncbi:hypothetical protein [Burkholderia latens]|uniref:hypothetical protein n=1 Tax=Burkholderia latens TaxID=488446 RepID=UPI00158A0B7C|nr:hypothetical protein [Burkholderia latens]